MTLLLLALPTLLAAECPAPTTSLQLAANVRDADTAFTSMQLDAFTEARDRADDTLRCLGEVVNTADAAAYHRMKALDAFLAEDSQGAVGAFAAVRSLQPGATLDERLAPLGNPLRAAWDAAGLVVDTGSTPLPAPTGTLLLLDGEQAADRPASRPVILQASSPAGRVSHTTWLRAGALMPDWASATALAVEDEGPDNARRTRKPRSRATRPLAIAAGASAVVAGGLYGYAWVPRGHFMDDQTPLGDLDGYQSATNAATIGAVVAGGLAVGTGVGAVLTVAW